MMKWRVNVKFSKNWHYEIKYDPSVGFYLYVFENNKCIYDALQDSLKFAIEFAHEKFGIPKDAWKKID